MTKTRYKRQNKSKGTNRITNKTKTKKHRIFKKGDFYSGDGMVTKIWGPAFWHSLHTISFNYPVKPTEQEKVWYRDYILSLQHILPCKYCRQNFTTNLKQLPLSMCKMKSRDTFSRYIYDLHELVNKLLKKKSGLTYCDVRERYEHFRSRCTEEKPIMATFTKKETDKEKGCTEPLYGKKAKCIIKIVPQDDKGSTMQIDSKCIKKRE